MSDASTSEVTYGPKRSVGETRAMVLKRKRQGLSTREIAALTGISTQAVNLHIKRLRADGELEEAS